MTVKNLGQIYSNQSIKSQSNEEKLAQTGSSNVDTFKKKVKASTHQVKIIRTPEIKENQFLEYAFNHLPWLILTLDAILSIAVILFAKWVNIDWYAYMEQTGQFLAGERNYLKMRGNTGPLVYPAGFLYIFSIFREMTDDGKNILAAQFIFLGIYLIQQALTIHVYSKTNMPKYWFIPLLLSKRIHSIYLLRCFNDPVSTLFSWISINFLTSNQWTFATISLSLAVLLKMNSIFYMPAFAFLMYLSLGLWKSMQHAAIFISVQVLLGLPFLTTYPVEYLSKSFEFSRVFEYIWTVNWKMVPEYIFDSKGFSIGLLVVHLILLVLFVNYVWLKCCVGCQSQDDQNEQKQDLWIFIKEGLMKSKTQFKFVFAHEKEDALLILFTSNLIGMVAARSLHYQFYTWYFHTLPFLVWKGLPWYLGLTSMLMLESSWIICPSNSFSSSIMLIAHLLLLTGILVRKSNNFSITL